VKFLITAGPTREPIDPVRYLSNRSSGKMGHALATAALEAGHEVTLVRGPVDLPAPERAKIISVITSDEMFAAVRGEISNCDVFVMCAAVCDYKPAKYSAQKLKKEPAQFQLTLIPTRDILASLPNENRPFITVGFAAETENLEANAVQKLIAKKCDAMVANDVSDSSIGMESDENAVQIFWRNGERETMTRAKKIVIARELIKKISRAREKSLTKKT
jgi:phosphopantothenoylcysteine decarboxylase/phosphopantothenate--cysteine ligase